MNRTEIINKLISYYNYTSYLEIGIFDGVNYNLVNCNYKVGIDPSPRRKVNNLVRDASDNFFKTNKNKFDIVFIDGLHHFDQVKKDLENSIKCLSKNGSIVVHDCNPTNELMQKVPREVKTWTGDVWKAWIEFIKQYSNNYDMFTVDTDMGVGVVTKGITSYQCSLPKSLSYRWLEKNRVKALNLISIKDFNNKLL